MTEPTTTTPLAPLDRFVLRLLFWEWIYFTLCYVTGMVLMLWSRIEPGLDGWSGFDFWSNFVAVAALPPLVVFPVNAVAAVLGVREALKGRWSGRPRAALVGHLLNGVYVITWPLLYVIVMSEWVYVD